MFRLLLIFSVVATTIIATPLRRDHEVICPGINKDNVPLSGTAIQGMPIVIECFYGSENACNYGGNAGIFISGPPSCPLSAAVIQSLAPPVCPAVNNANAALTNTQTTGTSIVCSYSGQSAPCQYISSIAPSLIAGPSTCPSSARIPAK
ncbi:hypothetical protein DFH06DRAFT_1484828 [Mycena polygramma]|nr:hypothetical protein DFH06DRAFT_1484828 [Mycena polygramma]